MLLVEAPEHGLDRVLGQEWLVTPDGLEEVDLTFSENSIRTIIHHYTREADVRSLEREIASLCRKTALRVVREGKRR